MNSLSAQAVVAAENPRDRLAAMLAVMAVQIDAALQESNPPAATLVETAHALGKATETVARCLLDFSGSPARVFQDLMILHDDMHARTAKAATAIQFHDRLVQCLTHVCASMNLISELLTSGGTLRSADWDKLQDRIRGTLSMEQERELFDLLSGGAAPDSPAAKAHDAAGKIELF
jgi:hypothetical protein